MAAIPPKPVFPVRGIDPVQRNRQPVSNRPEDRFTPAKPDSNETKTEQSQFERVSFRRSTTQKSQTPAVNNSNQNASTSEVRQNFTLQTLSAIAGMLVGEIEQSELSSPSKQGVRSDLQVPEISKPDQGEAQQRPLRPGSKIDFSA